MRKLIVALFCAFLSLPLAAQTVRVETNEFVDLMNTLWLLSQDEAPNFFTQETFDRFGDLKNHHAVQMLKRKGINERTVILRPGSEFISLTYMAFNLEFNKQNKIVFASPEKFDGQETRAFWLDSIPEFVEELNDFYVKSKFHEYYVEDLKTKEMEQYLEMNTRFVEINDFKLDKVNQLLGTHIKELVLYTTLVRPNFDTGVPCIKVDGKYISTLTNDLELAWERPRLTMPQNFIRTTKQGDPLLAVLTALVMEEENKAELTSEKFASSVAKLEQYAEPSFAAYGISAKSFVSKALPLLLAYKYREGKPTKYIDYAESCGMIWFRHALAFMDNYYNNRDKYPQLRDFIPQFMAYVDYLPTIMPNVKNEWDAKYNPYVESVFPASGATISLSDEVTINVKFSTPIKSVNKVLLKTTVKPEARGDVKMSYEMIDDTTLQIKISGKDARRVGFYGIEIPAEAVENIYGKNIVRDLLATYFITK